MEFQNRYNAAVVAVRNQRGNGFYLWLARRQAKSNYRLLKPGSHRHTDFGDCPANRTGWVPVPRADPFIPIPQLPGGKRQAN